MPKAGRYDKNPKKAESAKKYNQPSKSMFSGTDKRYRPPGSKVANTYNKVQANRSATRQRKIERRDAKGIALNPSLELSRKPPQGAVGSEWRPSPGGATPMPGPGDLKPYPTESKPGDFTKPRKPRLRRPPPGYRV